MSQNWVADLYTTGTIGDTTLSNMELMFATLRSNFSGASTPANPVDGNLYYDTGSDLLKAYRSAAWAGVLVGSAAFKIWLYLNAAEDGWLIDASSVTDRVLAFKGGSQAYNRTGGGNAGAWAITGISVTNHPSHIHTLADAGAGSIGHLADKSVYKESVIGQTLRVNTSGGTASHQRARYWTGGPSVALNHTESQNGLWRPAGAVGTLQYPDMT